MSTVVDRVAALVLVGSAVVFVAAVVTIGIALIGMLRR
jgi:hypothetical protein